MEKAGEYIEWDVNPETKKHIQALFDAKDVNALSKLLSNRLQFGTSGLRGPMGPGYNRINELVVLQTCQGLIAYLEQCLDPAIARENGVVIGYDHRKQGSISSLSLARVSAAVFLFKGYKVKLLENFVPTPFVAFGVRHYRAAAGIMITASHNPKLDDGFKLFWSNGSLIIPPVDAGVAQNIEENLKPWTAYDFSNVLSHPNAEDVTSSLQEAYYRALLEMKGPLLESDSSPAIITYTAMHGVGAPWIRKAFEVYGYAQPVFVTEQEQPDPEFPTVTFPNPEEKGALTLAIATANRCGSNVVIANDPDADRLAVAERQRDGIWHTFTGNEIGVFLGHWQISRWKRSCVPGARAAVLASVVSSRMLKSVATAEGILYFDTLTGFKWLGNRSYQLRQEGIDVIFSYEEALGYCLGNLVADKDGISAAVIFIELVNTIYSNKLPGITSVLQYLQSLYSQYGQFLSYNSYVFSYDKSVTDAIFYRLRHADGSSAGYSYGVTYGGVGVQSVKDVTVGYDSTSVDGSSDLPVTADNQMIMYEFSNGCSLTLRTSGTEPKIKYYAEIAASGDADVDNVRRDLETFVTQIIEEMLQPDVNGLNRT